MRAGPAYRVLTPRLLLRCWEPADAPLLQRAVEESVEHLRPWMPWAENEPETVDEKVAHIRRFRGRFDLGEDFVYAIFDRGGTEVLGGTGLHTRVGPDAREIGYWIHVDHVGRGYATEASAALTRVAFEVDGVERVEIHCRATNERSAAIPRKLGFSRDGALRKRRDAQGRDRVELVWSLLRHELEGSPVAEIAAAVRAEDALGRPLL